MTDYTPHEALPQVQGGYRQFFRVVGPDISHWYEEHSTANPKDPLPNHVKIVNGNKFQSRKKKEDEVAKRDKHGNDYADDGASRKRSDWRNSVRILFPSRTGINDGGQKQ